MVERGRYFLATPHMSSFFKMRFSLHLVSAQIQKLQEKMKDLHKEIADEYDRIQTPMGELSIKSLKDMHVRKLSEFKMKAGQALWFAGSFGLELDFM